MKKVISVAAVVLIFGGCASAPPDNRQQPLAANDFKIVPLPPEAGQDSAMQKFEIRDKQGNVITVGVSRNLSPDDPLAKSFKTEPGKAGIEVLMLPEPDGCSAGRDANIAKQYREAIEPLTRCLANDLDADYRAHILQNRAFAYHRTKQYEMALTDQKESIALKKPADPWPYITIGVTYKELKRYEESLAAFRVAAAIDATGGGGGMPFYYNTGETLHEMGRYTEAIEAYTKGIPFQPGYGYVFYRRALSYEALGDRERARLDLAQALKLVPKDGYEPEIEAKINEYGFVTRVMKAPE